MFNRNSNRSVNRFVIAGLSAALLWSSAGGAGAHDVVAGRSAGADDVAVTLITGDQVVLPDGDVDGAWVRSGAGRDDITFSINTVGDRLHVVPSDAAPLVADDRVDSRLFDVTRLIEYGYDDTGRERRDSLPIIARQSPRGSGELVGGLLRAVGALVTGSLDVLGLSTAQVPKDDAGNVWSSVTSGGIERLWLDAIRRPMLDDSIRQIRGDRARSVGLDGSGVTVAVLDTGVDTTHPDLARQIVESKNFTDERGDQLGHGTHVASILAGTGTASDGRYVGVAPGARLLNAKVCTADSCPESGILAGMEWAAADKDARIVNFSLGDADTPGIDPLEEAVNRLTKKTGALFVAAAGNGGRDGEPVISPASADSALAVGAVDDDGNIAPFSARGPRVGDGALKPDITAPGVGIVAARAEGSEYGLPVGSLYQTINGTSMATPHVSGAAAILAQLHPRWEAEQLKAALMQSARPNPVLSPVEQGAGLLDVAAATRVGVVTEPAAVNVEPSDNEEQTTRALTYRNLTSETVVLRLSVTAGGPESGRAPRDLARVNDRLLVLPPNGTAETAIVVDTTDTGATRHWGWVEARGSGHAFSTPFVVNIAD